MALARSPVHLLLGRHVKVLAYTAPVSGRSVQLPVQAVSSGGKWLVAVGSAERKTWWRAFRHPHPAVLRSGRTTRPVIGRLLKGPVRETALTAYLQSRGRGGTLDTDTPVVEFRQIGPET
jgi:hypothetical protein